MKATPIRSAVKLGSDHPWLTLFVAVAIVLINFIFDFLFTIVDPRIARE